MISTNATNNQYLKIKQQIEEVFKKTDLIHVSINNRRNRIKEAPSKIVGIYDRFVCVEAKVNNYLEKFTINYNDLLTNNVIIKEL